MPLVHVPSTATLTPQRSRGTDGPASAGGGAGAGERPSSGIFQSIRQRRHSLPRAETTATLPPYEPSAPLTTWTSRGADRFAERSCSIERVKGYLLVLAAFSSILDKLSTVELPCCHPTEATSFECAVEGCEGRMSDESKLGLFVEMAVRRFGYWQEKVLSTGSNELPPLDVLLVWVTYLGSPLWYDDDSKLGGKTHPQSVYRDFPLEAVIACIDPDTLEYAPFITEVWKGATGIPFSPIDHLRTSTSASITCPRCQTSFSCPWMSPDRTGYAQCGFKVSCPMTNCRLEVTKEAIGVGRMAKRLVRLYEMPTCQLGRPAEPSARSAVRAVRHERRHGAPAREPLGVEAVQSARLSRGADAHGGQARDQQAHERVCGVGRCECGLGPVYSAPYCVHHDAQEAGVAGVDLVDSAVGGAANGEAAVCQVHQRMLERSLADSEVLDHCSRPRAAPCTNAGHRDHLADTPARGVELQTCALVGRVVDRDDAVEESFLAAGFKRTAERWKSINNAPYTTSGTLLPLELRGLAARFAVRLHLRPISRSQSHSRSRLSLEAKIDYDNPIVYAVADSSLSLPCERNSIAIVNDDKAVARRAVRRAEYEACRCEALGRAEEGKVDPDFAARLRDEMATQPAFMSDAFDHADCGPHGYPVSPSGLMVSGNHLAGRMVSAPWKGNGVVGAGLWRRDDAELAKNPPWNGVHVDRL